MSLKTTFISLCALLISFAASSLSISEKENIVEEVYKKVYAAMGLAENPPLFVFNTRESSRVAYLTVDRDANPVIGFEEKAFDVCASFGEKRDEAIAYIIGHEIAHHHLGHRWGKDYFSAYSVNNLIRDMNDVDSCSIVKYETQADERGGIYCYLAGYNVIGIAEELLQRLYKAYGFKNVEEGYPSLNERIQISKDQDSIVSTYIKVFETGNYAMLLGEYQIAIDAYEYAIGKRFHSREIYNNLGVAYFLQGLKKSDPDEIKYIYPIEIDLESRVNRGGSKGMTDEIRALFQNSLKKFEQATLFDKNYSTGYLNQSCVHSVFKEFEDAQYFLNKAIKAAKNEGLENVQKNAQLVQAILLHQNPKGDKKQLKKIMNKLIKEKDALAKYNQQIFEGVSSSDIKFSAYPPSWEEGEYTTGVTIDNSKKETLDNIRTYEGNLDVNSFEEIKYTRFESIECGERNTSIIYRVENANNQTFIFHATKANYSGETANGIKIGSNKAELIKRYGIPSAVMSSRQGTILLYNKHNIMFFLNQNDLINTWVIFVIYT